MHNAVIIGGSRGIGREITRSLQEEGWRTVVCARHEAADSESLKKDGCGFFRCDAGDSNQVRELYRYTKGILPSVDALIINAGMAWEGLIQDMPEEVFDELYRNNLKSAFLCAKQFLPDMISQKSGSVVFVSSMWGVIGASCEAAYSAFKAGIIGFAKSLAKELGPSGIRVNVLCPGFVKTEMTRHLGESVAEQMIDETPLGRICTVHDCADAVLFLCSQRASFITGQVLNVSGGMVI